MGHEVDYVSGLHLAEVALPAFKAEGNKAICKSPAMVDCSIAKPALVS
jgi:hypothetical protein